MMKMMYLINKRIMELLKTIMNVLKIGLCLWVIVISIKDIASNNVLGLKLLRLLAIFIAAYIIIDAIKRLLYPS